MNENIPLKILKLYWEGPFSVDEAIEKFNNQETDYGLYQIYGNHNVNGTDNLLYVGKAQNNIFRYRFEDHKKSWIDKEPSKVELYVGRFFDEKQPTTQDWDNYIDASEKMIIYHCQPSYNIREKFIAPTFPTIEYLILNIGKRHKLPAEISTFYFKNHETTNPKNTWKFG